MSTSRKSGWDLPLCVIFAAVIAVIALVASSISMVSILHPFCYFPGCVEPLLTLGLALGLVGPWCILGAVARVARARRRAGRLAFTVPLVGIVVSAAVFAGAFVLQI